MSRKQAAQPQFLNGWKEIANYLGKGVRTVQRYERDMGLPILRPAGTSAAAVVAMKAALDEWVTAPHTHKPSRTQRQDLKSRTNLLRANFLQIDSEIALTFANLALTATSPEKKRRTAQTARRAFDAIMRLREDTDLGDADKDKLEANLRRLKSELQSLGQRF